jgi:RNA polymerase sigma factor (sigma-70 family)
MPFFTIAFRKEGIWMKSQSHNTRESLLLRLRDQRDEQSWEDFVFYYQGYIYKVISNMNMRHEDVLDLTQIIMLQLWQKLPTFEFDSGKARFRTWLSRIVRNRTLNYIRDNAKHKQKTQSCEPDVMDMHRVELPEIEKIAAREWKEYIARMAWDNIRVNFTENVCECFVMVSCGTPVKEVCEKLGISENSAYVYKKRVKDPLMREIRRLEEVLG